jgi:hypothetical protein
VIDLVAIWHVRVLSIDENSRPQMIEFRTYHPEAWMRSSFALAKGTGGQDIKFARLLY